MILASIVNFSYTFNQSVFDSIIVQQARKDAANG